MALLLPRPSTNRFADFLAEVGGSRRFDTHRAMTSAMARCAQHHHMSPVEAIEAALTSLVSAVQASAPESEWREVGERIADEVRRRLTVTGVR